MHHFTSLKSYLIFLQLGVLEWKCPCNWCTNTWHFSLIFSPTSNHLHPLHVENCDSNSRHVVDEDDNGKFRVKPSSTSSVICLLMLLSVPVEFIIFVLSTLVFFVYYYISSSIWRKCWVTKALLCICQFTYFLHYLFCCWINCLFLFFIHTKLNKITSITLYDKYRHLTNWTFD